MGDKTDPHPSVVVQGSFCMSFLFLVFFSVFFTLGFFTLVFFTLLFELAELATMDSSGSPSPATKGASLAWRSASSSPNAGSTGFLHNLAMCPKPPHRLHFLFLAPMPAPSALDLILVFLRHPFGLLNTGACSLKPGSTMSHCCLPTIAGMLSTYAALNFATE